MRKNNQQVPPNNYVTKKDLDEVVDAILVGVDNLFKEERKYNSKTFSTKEDLRFTKEDLKMEIGSVREDVRRIDEKVEENGKRLDKIGIRLAELEDDAPTIEEFDNLDNRVKYLEKQAAII